MMFLQAATVRPEPVLARVSKTVPAPRPLRPAPWPSAGRAAGAVGRV